MSLIQKVKRAYITLSAAVILLGVVILLFPQISMKVLCFISGLLVTALGVVKLFGYFTNDLYRLAFQFDFAFGILSLAVGAVMLVHPENVVRAVPVLIGFITLADSAFKLQTSYDAKRFGLHRWWCILLLACVGAVLGVLLILHPMKGASALMTLMGLALIAGGVQNLCIVLYTVKEAKKLRPITATATEIEE